MQHGFDEGDGGAQPAIHPLIEVAVEIPQRPRFGGEWLAVAPLPSRFGRSHEIEISQIGAQEARTLSSLNLGLKLLGASKLISQALGGSGARLKGV
ncbi:hypothetical protein CRG98_001030 [Punica granatum]|uniref:Uncharacterized protein n=1 Tax=Punica granatum TaxID=22663 RepID=A0A2I0LD98_PUNGR|nr:hypothetical protein CRG98_001030 [Punica granatum]